MRRQRFFGASVFACVAMFAVACAPQAPGPGPTNLVPIAVATATPQTGDAPLDVQFDSSTSTDADGTIVSHLWDFGDTTTSTDANPLHTFAAAGTFEVTLTVTDDDGATGSTTLSIEVTIAPDDPNGRYVATAGTDAGDCSTSAAPCATVGYAVGQAVAGNSVYVGSGDYAELVTVDKALSFVGANAGTSGAGTRGAESTVKGFRTPGNPGTVQYDVSIDGFRIDPQGDAALISATLQPLVWLRGGPTGVTVANNVFHGGDFVPNCWVTCTTMTDAAFTVQSGTVEFSDNLVENFRRPVNINQALGAPATFGTVSDNVITGVTSRAISIAGSTGVQMAGANVTGNIISGGGTAAPSSPAGMTISNGGNNVDSNVITGVASGVYVDICKKFVMANNSITNNTLTGNAAGVNINVNFDGGQCVNSVTEGTAGWVIGGGKLDGLTITGNDLSGNTAYAIRHAAYNWGFWNAAAPAISNGLLDASCNWYGTPTGPVNEVLGYPNSGFTSAQERVVDSGAPHTALTTAPWLTSATGPCDGGV